MDHSSDEQAIEREDQWVAKWLSLINKMPAPLLMMIDAEASDTPVVVVSPNDHQQAPHHTRWLNRMCVHLAALPGGGTWLLANVDGWHLGKGQPTVSSGFSYSAHGACSSNSDDYADHYIQSVMMPYGAIPKGYQQVAELRGGG